MRGSLDGGFGVDSNGCPTERVVHDGQEIIVHYDDIPDSDITVVRGLPCTTALRTVIDIAPELGDGELGVVVRNCLDRGLFDIPEAAARLAQPDMAQRPAARLLRAHLGL